MLEEKITVLKQKIVESANIVESMLEKCINSLVNKDENKLNEVINIDEQKVNEYEIELDELCTNVIAQYQPRAKNLRIILMILKMNNDLERMGDHVVNIAESCLYLINKTTRQSLNDITQISEIARTMLKDSISSFIKEDGALAKSVCEKDDQIDDLRKKYFSRLVADMKEDEDVIDQSMHIIRIIGNLERIADLSTNICEDVLYVSEGRVIKHHASE
ncbi:MAG: phosphate signaling complex protein PhoU [Endomicrobiales bacterium]|nr:phosphate signaling complex protein PhoU [Endomicrobiales bacterium]